jgi:inner membrane transporter RhtA
MSIEPAIAALVGFLMLGEVLSLQSVIAIALVTIAAMGSTASRS